MRACGQAGAVHGHRRSSLQRQRDGDCRFGIGAIALEPAQLADGPADRREGERGAAGNRQGGGASTVPSNEGTSGRNTALAASVRAATGISRFAA